jgi:hypothetical protein
MSLFREPIPEETLVIHLVAARNMKCTHYSLPVSRTQALLEEATLHTDRFQTPSLPTS